jgi:hypothetical protein
MSIYRMRSGDSAGPQRVPACHRLLNARTLGEGVVR